MEIVYATCYGIHQEPVTTGHVGREIALSQVEQRTGEYAGKKHRQVKEDSNGEHSQVRYTFWRDYRDGNCRGHSRQSQRHQTLRAYFDDVELPREQRRLLCY